MCWLQATPSAYNKGSMRFLKMSGYSLSGILFGCCIAIIDAQATKTMIFNIYVFPYIFK